MTGAQTLYFEEPESQRVHLVREHNSQYDKKWCVGLRFLESRKPCRSTWLLLSVLTLSWVPAFFSKQIAQLRGGIHSRQSYFLSGNHLCSTPLNVVDRHNFEISVPIHTHNSQTSARKNKIFQYLNTMLYQFKLAADLDAVVFSLVKTSWGSQSLQRKDYSLSRAFLSTSGNNLTDIARRTTPTAEAWWKR